jgi:hypothetical protein
MSEKANYIEKLKEKPELLKTLPKEYLADKDIIRAALVRNWYKYESYFLMLELFKESDATLRYNKDFVKELIQSCTGYLFEHLPLALREDEEILLFALNHSGYEYISNCIKINVEAAWYLYSNENEQNNDYVNDWETYVDSISYDLNLHICNERSVMRYAGEIILNTKEVILKTLALEEKGFSYVSKALKDDKEVALAAVFIDGTNFENLSDRLKDDDEIALAAAEGNGTFLAEFGYEMRWGYLNDCFFEQLSERLKHNREFLITLIKNCSGGEFVLKFVSEQFKNDRELVLIAVKKYGKVLEYASDTLKNDKEIVFEAMKKYYYFELVSEELKNNKEFVLQVMDLNTFDFKYLSDGLKNDKDFIIKMANKKPSILNYVNAILQNDSDILALKKTLI